MTVAKVSNTSSTLSVEGAQRAQDVVSRINLAEHSEMHTPKGPSSPYLWFLVPTMAPKSLNNE